MSREPSVRSALSDIFYGIITAAVIVLVVSYFVSLAVGIPIFFMTKDGQELSARRISGLPLSIFFPIDFITSLRIPVSTTIGTVFAGLWTIYLVCFVWAWMDRDGFHRSVIRDYSNGLKVLRVNFLRALPIVASGMLILIVTIHRLQETGGVATGGISFPNLYVALFSLAYAPVNEELSYRITPLGIIIAASLILAPGAVSLSLSRRLRLVVLAFLSPERAKKLVGASTIHTHGLRAITLAEWVMVIVSSVIFGAAHFLFGAGWEAGKISTAMLSGFTLALVYLAYGAYAPILLHWFFNYYFMSLEIASTNFGALFAAMTRAIDLVNTFFGILVLIVGAVITIITLIRRL